MVLCFIEKRRRNLQEIVCGSGLKLRAVSGKTDNDQLTLGGNFVFQVGLQAAKKVEAVS